MAKDKITEYDSTANNNTVCGDVNIAENSALPSDMNNFAREIMSHLKEGLGSGTPLYVDQTNNRVGINKTPTVALDVSGSLSVDGGTIKLDGNYPVGTGNVAMGNQALDDGSLSGTHNTAIGNDSLTSNTSGGANTSVGSYSLDANTTGNYNTAVGYFSLTENTTGSNNTGIGRDALRNTTASNNTAVGYQALYNVTTGSANVGIGYQAGSGLTTGVYNTIIGMDAGESITTANDCTFIGRFAGNSTTGQRNTFLGKNSGYLVTSGTENTILGSYNGNQGGLDIRTSSNNIVLSDGDGNPRGHWSQSRWNFQSDTANETVARFQNGTTPAPYGIYINFNNASPDNNSQYFIRCEDSTTQRFNVFSDGDVTNHDNSYGAISDIKLKEQITDASSQWEDIKALTVRKYKMKEDVSTKGDSDALWRLGVVAQEVETAGMNGLISESIDRDSEMNDLGTTTKTVKYSILYMKAVKALQEAMERIETLEQKVATLEGA